MEGNTLNARIAEKNKVMFESTREAEEVVEKIRYLFDVMGSKASVDELMLLRSATIDVKYVTRNGKKVLVADKDALRQMNKLWKKYKERK